MISVPINIKEITRRAHRRINNRSTLSHRIKVLREELKKYHFDCDITKTMQGNRGEYSYYIKNDGVWIQLFPGKGCQNYAMCIRINPFQDVRIEKLNRIFEIDDKLN